MNKENVNVTLIGMPGVGKSFLGRKLAEKLNFSFLDTDELIEQKNNLSPQQIINKYGDNKFLELERKAILNLGNLTNTVVSTGGSVVYIEEAMEFLKKFSKVIFLHAPLEIIKKRLTDKEVRGIVGLRVKTLEQIFSERNILYSNYADIVIEIKKENNSNKLINKVLKKLNI